MAYYNYDDRYMGGRYNMGYQPAYNDRDMMLYNRGGYDRSPVAFRQEPFYDSFRRGYHEGGAYDGRYGSVPREEVFRRVDAPRWMDQGRGHFQDLESRYGRGQFQDGYRLHRYEHGGRRDYGHAEFDHHGADDYQRRGNHQQRTAVELYVPICCDKCERKLRKHMDYIPGVENVTVDQVTKKVVVFGFVNPSHVLSRARQDKPEADFWHLALYR